MNFTVTRRNTPAPSIKVFQERGVVATFAVDPAGEAAFAAFQRGCVSEGHTLFDEDAKQFLVGSVGDLAS